jgi:hypothetical protein
MGSLDQFRILEESVNHDMAMSVKFGRPRFVVERTDGCRSDKFMSYEFAKQLFEDTLRNSKVLFVHEDGTEEDFTQYFQ